MPVALVLLFGFTISTDIHNASIAVLDHAKDTQSQNFIQKLSSSNYFQIVSYPSTEAEIDFQFKENNIKLAIIIPQNFESQLEKEHSATIQIIDDVSDLNIASILNNYVRSVTQDFQNEYNQHITSADAFSITKAVASMNFSPIRLAGLWRLPYKQKQPGFESLIGD